MNDGRLLEEDRGRRLSSAVLSEADRAAWRAAALMAIVALLLVLVAAIYMVLWARRHRRLKGSSHSWSSYSTTATAPGDLEAGMGGAGREAEEHLIPANRPESHLHSIPNSMGEDGPDAAAGRCKVSSPPVDRESREAMRELLKEEIRRSIQRSEMNCRLDELEHRRDPSLPSRASRSDVSCPDKPARVLHGELRLCGTAAPNERAWPESSCIRPPTALMEKPMPPSGDPPSPKMFKSRDVGVSTDPASLNYFGQESSRPRLSGSVPNALFGPTRRQMRHSEPPEKKTVRGNELECLKQSTATLEHQLNQRDRQSKELHCQLELCQTTLKEQTAVTQRASRRLEELLRDPKAAAPRLLSEEVAALRRQAIELRQRVQSGIEAERFWRGLARSQRAYFVQSERLTRIGVRTVRRHPCGDVFLADAHPAGDIQLSPPPATQDEMLIAGADRPPWDVGTSTINPYVTDSWPFEPNVLASRTNMEATLASLKEADEEFFVDDDEEDYFMEGDDCDAAEGGEDFCARHLPPRRLVGDDSSEGSAEVEDIGDDFLAAGRREEPYEDMEEEAVRQLS